MIIFQHDHIIQSHPVVLPAAYPDRLLVQDPHTGSCFPGIEYFCVQVLDFTYIPVCLGGNATHALQDIQYNPF